MYMLGEMRGDIKSILEQAKKTNGRVSVLEDKTEKHGEFITGFKAKVAVIIGIISFASVTVFEFIKTKFIQ
jgi:hypothetical protein